MGTTEELAEFCVRTSYADLPANVLHAAKRDVINVIGVSIYASRDPSLSILLSLFEAEGGRERATIWGSSARTGLQNAALANGYLAHLEDYDDTHFPTVLHPSAPTVPAAWAIAESGGRSGADLLAAVALGIEAICRISLAVHPWHYDAGWHITGTMGVFGGAVAAGKLLGLDAAGFVACLGIAGSQAAGVREAFGSMTKPFHAGNAARSGVVAALLAQGGFTATDRILEGRRGVAAVLSAESDLTRVTEGLGERWEIFNNGLKPYACGVVNHPLIDACIELRNGDGFDLGAIEAIEADVHPLVLELVNLPEPKVGLEGKFSVQHCVAVGLTDGAAYPEQFSDAKVTDPALIDLRRKVRLVKNESFGEDEAVVRLTIDGRKAERHVEHATGAPQNPFSDDQLNAKFLTLTAPVLGGTDAEALLAKLWRLDEQTELVGLLEA